MKRLEKMKISCSVWRSELSLDADNLHFVAVGNEGDLSLEIDKIFNLGHETSLELVIEGQAGHLISSGSLPFFLIGDIVLGLGFSPVSEVEEIIAGEAIVLVLLPVNRKLVHVDTETLSVSGSRHPLRAKSFEVGGHIALSDSGGDLLFTHFVEYFHVLEEGVGVTVPIPDNEVLTSITSCLTFLLHLTHSAGNHY